MPTYEIIDSKGIFAWTKLQDGSYIVDQKFEDEFINFFAPLFPELHAI